MKKLMIAAVAVCAAALAQAGSINWSTAAKLAKNQDGSNLSPKTTIYLLQTDVTGETGYDALIQAITKDGFDSSTIESWDAYAGKLTTTSSTSTKSYGKGSGTAVTKATDSAGEYETHNFNAIIFQKGEDNKEYYLLTSVSVQGKAKDPNDPIDQQNDPAFGSANFSGSTWTEVAQSAPEPTSAMLLLLGVAGLALKRRRA